MSQQQIELAPMLPHQWFYDEHNRRMLTTVYQCGASTHQQFVNGNWSRRAPFLLQMINFTPEKFVTWTILVEDEILYFKS
jgi:hypothetical protein